MTVNEGLTLFAIATLGHGMALFWYLAKKRNWRICERTIYDVPIKNRQMVRELKNSIHTPIHAVILGLLVWFGFFANGSWQSFFFTLLVTAIWAEIWHYFSHRLFHLNALHWIHAEHHKSHLNTPFTAISFSFSEKLIFDIGMVLPFVALDSVLGVNFFGIAAWFIGYLIINSFSHANFEFRAASYNGHVGKVLTTTTYHALHHSRYTGNYGLGTRVLDRLLGTEWPDYEPLYDQINEECQPLSHLRERVERREQL